MRVCKHGCDITRILIGYVFSDARFDCLVGNISVYYINTDEIPRELSRENMISSHVKRSLLPWLHRAFRE